MSTILKVSPAESTVVQFELFSGEPFSKKNSSVGSPLRAEGGKPARRPRKGAKQRFIQDALSGDQALLADVYPVVNDGENPNLAFCSDSYRSPDDAVENVVSVNGQGAPHKDLRAAKRQAEWPQNLSIVMAFIAADIGLTKRQRADFLSALRGLSMVLDKDLELIPTVPDKLRELFRLALPVAHGVSENRWRHIRSRVTRAIRHSGAPITPGRSTSPRSFAWGRLFEALPKGGKIGLSRFMGFCSERAIEPLDVTQSAFDAFLDTLQTQSVVRSPVYSHRCACLEWNRAAGSASGWPAFTVKVPKNNRRYALEWSDFPASLLNDVNAYLERSAKPDHFDDKIGRALRPASIRLQRRQIQQMVSLLVQAGTPAQEIISLSVLVKPRTAKRILQAARKRLSSDAPHLIGMARLLRTIAKKWCDAPADALKTLGEYACPVNPASREMTQKNQDRLRQFSDPAEHRILLNLPHRTFEALAKQKTPNLQAARRAMCAVAVAFLTAVPLRIGNLLALDRDRHIVSVGHGRRQASHLVIPPQEVKNRVPLEAIIPPPTAALMELYIKRYLPIIYAGPTSLLFPNEEGLPRDQSSIATAICRFIKRETGLVMNVHLFRHLAVSSYLQRHPEDLETARRILGHKSISTTIRFYAHIQTAESFRRYDEFIGQIWAPGGHFPRTESKRMRGGQNAPL